MAGYEAWNPSQRLQRITKLAQRPDWSPHLHGFLLDALSDRSLREVTRNNIANGLVRQHDRSAELVPLLLAMIDDERESTTWRVYAVQHAAAAITNGAAEQTRTTIDRLIDTANTHRDAIGATALMHLHRLAAVYPAAADILDGLIESRIDDATCPDIELTTALSVIAERGRERDRPATVRALSNASSDTVRRHAIAALGRIGSAEDEALIASYTTSDNRLITTAADAALATLRRRHTP
ncbi:MAG: hypothetical protein H0V44_02020 [Planctomycetes bacterium]|nr:hypothetical protein [Planctomycetota bacterium]